MKKLINLLQNISYLDSIGDLNKSINNIHFDSRKVNNDDIFIAIRGTLSDGHLFIEKAIETGASVIICEEYPNVISQNITYIKVENSAKTLGVLAANFYNNPSKELNLIGITGTNGKTTSTTILYQLIKLFGQKSALLSTVENIIGDRILNSTHTTPDPITINKILREAVNEGCKYAFMEVSSHGIHQQRLFGLNFTGGGFTNITHDHLDYHKTFIEYIKAKMQFFTDLPQNAFAITNIDDKNGKVMLQNANAIKKSYALKTLADFKGKIIENLLDGMLLQFNGTEFWLPLSGEFNAYNALLAYGIMIELGFPHDEVIKNLSNIKHIKGRFESFKSNSGIFIVIDYAHTPDALENVLENINKIRTKNEKLITVFGCGGNRDKEKRPKMGKIACKLSDFVLITSDNPRNENADTIIDDIKSGISAEHFSKYSVLTNREEAIKNALIMANTNDIILIAGKGHENYQEINGEKQHFDDFEISKNILTQLKK